MRLPKSIEYLIEYLWYEESRFCCIHLCDKMIWRKVFECYGEAFHVLQVDLHSRVFERLLNTTGQPSFAWAAAKVGTSSLQRTNAQVTNPIKLIGDICWWTWWHTIAEQRLKVVLCDLAMHFICLVLRFQTRFPPAFVMLESVEAGWPLLQLVCPHLPHLVIYPILNFFAWNHSHPFTFRCHWEEPCHRLRIGAKWPSPSRKEHQSRIWEDRMFIKPYSSWYLIVFNSNFADVIFFGDNPAVRSHAGAWCCWKDFSEDQIMAAFVSLQPG